VEYNTGQKPETAQQRAGFHLEVWTASPQFFTVNPGALQHLTMTHKWKKTIIICARLGSLRRKAVIEDGSFLVK